jgi:hypothetical protein
MRRKVADAEGNDATWPPGWAATDRASSIQKRNVRNVV